MASLRQSLVGQPRLVFGAEARPIFAAIMSHTPPASGITFDAAEVGGVPGWWCRPEAAVPNAALLYFHGGGYVVGSALTHRAFVSHIVKHSGVSAFVADYGLAPEHPFPRAIEDAKAAHAGLRELGFERIVLGGDSAGGGLALSLLSQASAEAAVLLSPWTDLALTGASFDTADDPFLDRSALARAAALYLGQEDPSSPTVSPLYGKPPGRPVLVHVGGAEVLLDDSRRIPDAEVHVWEGLPHVFPSNLGFEASSQALEHIGAFVARSARP